MNIFRRFGDWLFRLLGLNKEEKKPNPLKDISCLVVWNSEQNSRIKAGVAVSKTKVLFVEHWCPLKGTKVRFANGVERAIDHVVNIGKPNLVDDYRTDAAVAVLDSPLPESIIPAVIGMPEEEEPVWIFNQHGKQIATVVIDVDGTVNWETELVDKDSGSPVVANRKGPTELISLATDPHNGPILWDLRKMIDAVPEKQV